MICAKERTVNGRTHHYHAEASALCGHLQLPFEHEIEPQAYTKLPEEGGYFVDCKDCYRLDGVMSFRAGYTHVAGNRSTKPNQGWTTLTTTVIEGLNVLEVVTADRIVGQIVTDHPLEGYVPSIRFLGTRFENLRISGCPVELDLDLNLLGGKPTNDAPYTEDSGLLARVKSHVDRVNSHKELPAALRERYNRLFSASRSPLEEIECSLVKSVAGAFPGTSHGNVISVPDFGSLALAQVNIKHEDYKRGTNIPKKTTVTLTMIDFHFGCAIDGGASTGTGAADGGTSP